MKNYEPTMADAEATIRSSILDGIASSYGLVPEKVVDAVYKMVTADCVKWSLAMIANGAKFNVEDRRKP